MDRFFIDERVGCIAVRDRQHPDYDPEYPGLHLDTPDVIFYTSGVNVQDPETGSWEWEMPKHKINKAHEVCRHLNSL
jgi:hypothetical protein